MIFGRSQKEHFEARHLGNMIKKFLRERQNLA